MRNENCFYRISVKALVLNKTRDKFLVTLEESGKWALPGGGLGWGATPHTDLPREIREEMGVDIKWMASHPSYFLTVEHHRGCHIANVLYETELESLEFTHSNECIDVRFVHLEDMGTLPVYPNVSLLAKMFDPSRHVSTT